MLLRHSRRRTCRDVCPLKAIEIAQGCKQEMMESRLRRCFATSISCIYLKIPAGYEQAAGKAPSECQYSPQLANQGARTAAGRGLPGPGELRPSLRVHGGQESLDVLSGDAVHPANHRGVTRDRPGQEPGKAAFRRPNLGKYMCGVADSPAEDVTQKQ